MLPSIARVSEHFHTKSIAKCLMDFKELLTHLLSGLKLIRGGFLKRSEGLFLSFLLKTVYYCISFVLMGYFEACFEPVISVRHSTAKWFCLGKSVQFVSSNACQGASGCHDKTLCIFQCCLG